MSQQQTSTYPSQQGDTGSGFVVGTDPPKAPMTQAELAALQAGGQQQGGQQPPTIVIQGVQAQPGWQPQPGVRYFTEDEVGAIRQEEKEKLYGRLQTVEEQLAQAKADREAREAALAQQQAEVEEARRRAEEEQMDVKQLLERRDSEWQQRFQNIEQERERDRLIFAQEQRYQQVEAYRRDRLAQESEWIFPELRDLVSGADEAEIDQAIEQMKVRTGGILQQVAAAQQQLPQQRPQTLRGVAPTGAPPQGPMEHQTSVQQISLEDLQKMDPRTFAVYRDQLLGIATRAGAAGLRRDQAQQ
jgi:hypothetical protein